MNSRLPDTASTPSHTPFQVLGSGQPLRLLADDLTGALDSAAAFATADRPVPVYLDTPPADDTAPVAVLATATRDVLTDALPAALAAALPWLAGAGLAFKKVDSLLRGNTFAEVAWLARAGGFARVVLAPAFPAQGRVTLAGRQCVPPAAGEPPQPLPGPPIAQALRLAGWPCDPAHTWVPDGPDAATLRSVAAAAVKPRSTPWLWCGSAGLAQALAHLLAPAGSWMAQAGAGARPLRRQSGPTLIVTASWQPVLRRQIDRLRAARPDLAVLRDPGLPDLHASCTALAADGALLLDLAGTDRLSPSVAAARLAQRCQAIVTSLPPPGRLVVLGGDTLRALCTAAGVQTLAAGPAQRVGWGQARLQGGAWDGLACDSRSGAFGGDDDLAAAVGHV